MASHTSCGCFEERRRIITTPFLFNLQQLSNYFENTRRAHAGADAHGDHAVLLLAPAQAVHQRRDTDGAGGTERVAQRDGAAQRIDLARVEAEVTDDGECLLGKSFVEFDPVHLVEGEVGLLEHLGNGFLRTDAMLSGLIPAPYNYDAVAVFFRYWPPSFAVMNCFWFDQLFDY